MAERMQQRSTARATSVATTSIAHGGCVHAHCTRGSTGRSLSPGRSSSSVTTTFLCIFLIQTVGLVVQSQTTFATNQGNTHQSNQRRPRTEQPGMRTSKSTVVVGWKFARMTVGYSESVCAKGRPDVWTKGSEHPSCHALRDREAALGSAA